MNDVTSVLQSLIRLPSVNPMGQPISDGSPDIYLEHRVTDYLESCFRDLGVPWQRQKVAEHRENILACLEGSRSPADKGSVLVYEVHQDTVPVDGMTIEPFGGELREGKVYGRGACDVKGSLASMLVAFRRLARNRPPQMPTVVLACTVNEEDGFSGATALDQLWRGESSVGSPLLHRPPDAIVVAEPTQLDVVVAHKGVLRWKCRTRGRATHSSRPERGTNAIYLMSHVIQALRHHHAQLTQNTHHPLLGTATLSVGTVHGGQSVNVVPDECVIEIDRRLLPDEDPDQVFQQVRQAIDQELADQVGNEQAGAVEHDPPYTIAGGLSNELNEDLASRIARSVRKLGYNGGNHIGVPFGTDAPAYASHCPTVVFGPGSIEQAHTVDEWIAVQQLEQASEVYYDLAAHWESGGPAG